MAWGQIAAAGIAAFSAEQDRKSREDSSVDFVEDPTSSRARGVIQGIVQTSVGKIPGQEIAPLSDLEKQAIELAGEFMKDTSGEVTIDRAIDVAIGVAEEGIDLNSPIIQGLIQEVRKSGDLALNRIQRQLQKQGTLSTSQGRDVAGRSIADTERATAAAVSPLIANLRGQQLQAASLVPSLVGQKDALTTDRIATGAAAGGALTSLQQRISDAVFRRKQTQFEFSTTGRAGLASLLIQNPTGVVTPGTPGALSTTAQSSADVASLFGSTQRTGEGLESLFGKKKTTAPTTPNNQNVNSRNFDPGGELN